MNSCVYLDQLGAAVAGASALRASNRESIFQTMRSSVQRLPLVIVGEIFVKNLTKIILCCSLNLRTANGEDPSATSRNLGDGDIEAKVTPISDANGVIRECFVFSLLGAGPMWSRRHNKIPPPRTVRLRPRPPPVPGQGSTPSRGTHTSWDCFCTGLRARGKRR